MSTEFLEFRRIVDLEQAWPAPVEHLHEFMVYLYRKGLAPAAVQGKLSALAFYGKINGYRNFSGDYQIRKMLEGWSRERGRVGDTRAPISPPLLESICEHWALLCKDKYKIKLFHAASLIAFFGALRISSWG